MFVKQLALRRLSHLTKVTALSSGSQYITPLTVSRLFNHVHLPLQAAD